MPSPIEEILTRYVESANLLERVMSTADSKEKIVIHHSPDADDAFMFYGLTSGAVAHPDFNFEHDLCDIESLNQRALKGEVDVSAASVHAFAFLEDRYAILNCGASMGGTDYGPRVVAKKGAFKDFSELTSIAIPGWKTSAALCLQLATKEAEIEPKLVSCDFKAVFDKVHSGEVDAGVIIHEGQLTYQDEGLDLLLDLGQWWNEREQLPLPLGINIAKKGLGEAALRASAKVMYETIAYSLEHREAAIDYAMTYARGLSREHADKFIGMYVNDLTLDMGVEGREAISRFLGLAFEQSLIPSLPELEIIQPA